MSRLIEEPVSTMVPGPGRMDELKTTHPAFAQISASRCSGQVTLYGSDFTHHNFITISIKGSELHRNLNRDWHFARDELIEVAVSEAQWATFVSSLNMGSGVPCTIQREHTVGMVPQLPPPKPRADQFGAEMKESLSGAITALQDAILEAESLGLSKQKTERIKDKLVAALRTLSGTVPFVADQFGEHMEDVQEQAKVEIHGYTTSLLQRAGLVALAAGDPMVTLPGAAPKQIEQE